jgi:hypothetical protein
MFYGKRPFWAILTKTKIFFWNKIKRADRKGKREQKRGKRRRKEKEQFKSLENVERREGAMLRISRLTSGTSLGLSAILSLTVGLTLLIGSAIPAWGSSVVFRDISVR